MDLLKDYGQYWYVSITPYGRDIEPNVPDKHRLIDDFKRLSDMVGINSAGWRFDPIFISDRYTMDYQLSAFDKIASALDGYTRTVVISFIDLYEKVKRNFPQARTVVQQERIIIGKTFAEIGNEYGIVIKVCAEGTELAPYGVDCSGCMTIADYEKALGKRLIVPARKPARKECACYLSCDIGAYDSCRHLCRYCYANQHSDRVIQNSRLHVVNSPFLIGNYQEGDRIHDVLQKSWVDGQMRITDFM
jgi:DNA repair photolyase